MINVRFVSFRTTLKHKKESISWKNQYFDAKTIAFQKSIKIDGMLVNARYNEMIAEYET